MTKKAKARQIAATIETERHDFAPRPRYSSVRSLLGSEVAISKVLDYLMLTPDPDELLAKAGIRRHQLRSLELDDEVMQCLETRKDAVAGISWRLEPNTTRQSRYLRDVLKPHMDLLLSNILDAVPYGYSVQEMIYARDGSRIKLERVSKKPMEWFEPKPDGTLRYYPQDGTGGLEGIECDPRKFLLAVRRPSYANPRGEALLSRLYFPITWRREGWGMWLHFLETFGDPIVLGQVPDFRAFVEAMKAQGVRSTIAWQSTSDRDNVSTINASAPGEFERLENAIIKRVQKLLLGQTLTSDVSTSGGSYAQAAVHNQVRHDKTKSDVRLSVSVVQRLVDTLCELNGFGPLQFILADDAGLESARAARDAVLFPVLSGSGFKLTRSYFTDVYDYREEDLEAKPILNPLLQPGEPGADDPQDRNPNNDTQPTEGRSVADTGREGKAAQQNRQVGAPTAIQQQAALVSLEAQNRSLSPAQEVVERLLAEASERLKGRWPLSEADLLTLVQQSKNREDLERRLSQQIAADDHHEFEVLLAVLDYACRSVGYAGSALGVL